MGHSQCTPAKRLPATGLPRHLVAFRHKYPGIDIRLTISNTAQGAAAVHEGAADLAFIEGTIEDPMLTTEQVARDQVVIVVGIEHPWSTIDRLEPERLIETDWVLREPGSGVNRHGLPTPIGELSY